MHKFCFYLANKVNLSHLHQVNKISFYLLCYFYSQFLLLFGCYCATYQETDYWGSFIIIKSTICTATAIGSCTRYLHAKPIRSSPKCRIYYTWIRQYFYATCNNGITARRTCYQVVFIFIWLELGYMVVCYIWLMPLNFSKWFYRIDENMEDTVANVEGAQGALLKYLNGISSNRWLMMKIFFVLVVFLMIFLFFVA